MKADYTTVAPKVSGYIAEVLVGDNETVKAGQVLARIDDRDFKTALDQAQADVAAAEAAIRNLDAQIALQQPSSSRARRRRGRRSRAEIRAGRPGPLRRPDEDRLRHGAARAADRRGAARQQPRSCSTSKPACSPPSRKIDVLAHRTRQGLAQRDRARAVAQQAELNLSYTQITAPVDGTVGARSLRVGQYVQAGTQLMAVVPLHAVYVVANFKETQLTHVRAGQPVDSRSTASPASS